MGLIDPALSNEILVVRITPVEVAAALFRRVRAASVSAAAAQTAMAALRRDLTVTYQLIEVTDEVAEEALQIAERHGLRGYDCVQLAAAVLAQRRRAIAQLDPLTLVSADAELNAAAVAEELAVDDPNNHPP